MKSLVIIPTYNERDNIEKVIDEIKRRSPQVDILVVDDNSPDGTAELVKNAYLRDDSGVHLIQRVKERGLGSAYKAGFAYGLKQGYDVLITMDADFSHHPKYLKHLLEKIADHDLVIGSRYIIDGGTINWRIRRILLSWLANRFARFLLRIRGSDLTSGYRAYRRDLLNSIDLDRIISNGYSFLVEMAFFAQAHHARVAEIPIIFFDRKMGKSKISRKEIFRGVLTLLRLRFKKKKKNIDKSR